MKAGRINKRRDMPALEWLDDFAGLPRATLAGSSRVLIENYSGLIEFSPDRVRLSSKRGEIVVEGECLDICEVRPASLVVAGGIRSVLMPPDRGGKP